MKLSYKDGCTIKEFILDNQEVFEENLLSQAINVRDKIDEIRRIGNINLLDNARNLVLYIVEQKQEEVISFAKKEGIIWAKYSMELSFKLEWIQAIRRTLWEFLHQYEGYKRSNHEISQFFELEKRINEQIDHFLNHFFTSYSHFKDQLLENQKKLVENLSVPIIPISKEICILPLIGNLDQNRITIIQERTLFEIEKLHIQTLVIDLSGVANIDNEISNEFVRIIEGITLMGCRTVITGLSADIVRELVTLEQNFINYAEFKGTLQLALSDISFQH